MSKHYILAVVFFAIACAYTTASAATSTDLSVFVKSKGKPVAGEVVTLTGAEREKVALTTDANGVVLFPGIGAGEWVVEACNQSNDFSTADEEAGPGGLWVVECNRLYLPVAVK